MIKKILMIAFTTVFLAGCGNSLTNNNVIEIDTYHAGEEKGGIYTIDGNTITALSGSYIDFDLVSQERFGEGLNVTEFNIISSHKLYDIEYEDENGILRKGGGFTYITPYLADNRIQVNHRGEDDEAEIEVIGKKENGEDYKETYIIKYYCNCT